MNFKELAARLNGRQYRDEIDFVLEKTAKMNDLVIIFGASDDLMEFRGAINDEVGCYNGGEAFVDSNGLMPNFDELCENKDKKALRCYFKREPNARKIVAKWDNEGYSWTYETNIPHATFEIFDDGDKYCRGIVFSIG